MLFRSVLKGLRKEEENTQAQIEGIEAVETELWKEVYALQNDPAYSKNVEERIQKYLALTKEYLDKEA